MIVLVNILFAALRNKNPVSPIVCFVCLTQCNIIIIVNIAL